MNAPTPEKIAVWRFTKGKADEWVHGGWSEDHDHKTTAYIREDVAQAMAAVAAERALECLDQYQDDALVESARHILMVENIDAVADACRRFNVQQEKFRAVLSALKGGEA